MMKGLLLALGVAVGCAGFAATAGAAGQWEKALIQRYTGKHKCTGAGAPDWGRASMQRWRAAQRGQRRY